MTYRGYIFDLDGTLYRGERAIPGAPQTIAQLRRRGCGVAFLSNKPLKRRQAYAEKLTHLGIPTSPDKVMEERLVPGPGLLSGQQRTWDGQGHNLCLS